MLPDDPLRPTFLRLRFKLLTWLENQPILDGAPEDEQARLRLFVMDAIEEALDAGYKYAYEEQALEERRALKAMETSSSNLQSTAQERRILRHVGPGDR